MTNYTRMITGTQARQPALGKWPVGRGLVWASAGVLLGVTAWLLTRAPAGPSFEVAAHPPDIYDADIYEAGAGIKDAVYSPFSVAIDPMERLLLINFTEDPDAVYVGFEPQVFDDDVHGQGMIVIGWRVDGRVDVYHQPGLRLDPQTYDIAGDGLAHMVERGLEDAYFEVGPTGVDAWFAFEDVLGRPVEVTIREENRQTPAPFGLLAPMGNAASAPSALPLVFLHDFYFVRRAETTIQVMIEGQARQLDNLPLPVDGTPMYFTRYSPDPMIATLNPAHGGVLSPLTRVDANSARQGELLFDLVDHRGRPEILQMRYPYKERELRVRFSPPLPHLPSLVSDVQISGRFLIEADATVGTVSGEYRLRRAGDRVEMQVRPSGGWQPNEQKWAVRLMYWVARDFTRWPTTYVWDAELTLGEPETVTMESRWMRRD